MSLDLTGARATLQQLFMTRTLSVVRDGVTLTSLCDLTPRAGSTRREEGADVERGEYALDLPAGSALVLIAGEVVTIQGRAYRVVWAPARDALNLTDAYGVTEAR